MIEVGDARRCPSHPWVQVSSPCGLFDGLCGYCEHGLEPEPTGEAPPVAAPPVADDDGDGDDDLPF